MPQLSHTPQRIETVRNRSLILLRMLFFYDLLKKMRHVRHVSEIRVPHHRLQEVLRQIRSLSPLCPLHRVTEYI